MHFAFVLLFGVAQAFTCEGTPEEILSRVEAFTEAQKHERQRRVVYAASSGLGDQVSGFLAAVAFAMMTDRRLEVARRGFFGRGLETTFTADTTGPIPPLPPNPGRHNDWTLDEWHSTVREKTNDEAAVSNLFFAASHFLRASKFKAPADFGNTLNELFDSETEYIDFGNTGYYVVGLWLETFLGKKTAAKHHAKAMACVLRKTLRLSLEVQDLARNLTTPWPKESILAIHVRAVRYQRGGIYGDDARDDRVFGCAPPSFHVNNFTDVWDAAVALEKEQPDLSWRWLLVTDSGSLKKAALDTFGPEKILATTVVPTHNEKGCQSSQSDDVAALAELWLLAHADAILHGDSKYSTTAVFFCESCHRVVYLATCKERFPPVRRLCGDHRRRAQFAIGDHVRLDQVGGEVDDHPNTFSNLHSF